MRIKVKQNSLFSDKIDLLLIDGEYSLYRSHFAYSKPGIFLSTSSGTPSGAFYGFFSSLYKWLDTYGAESNIICWGSKRSDLRRRDLLPSYKSHRLQMPSELYNQEKDVKKALHMMQFPQYVSAGYEADDVIARFVYSSSIAYPERKVIIITADKDMRQLITESVKVIKPDSKGDVIFNTTKVREDFGVGPELLSDYLSLLGDDVDGIEGIPSIGEKTAAKLLQDNGGIKNWFNDIENINATDKIKKMLSENKDRLVLNKRLISLAESKTITVNILNEVEENETAEEIFDRYEMKKFRPEQFLKYR